MPEILRNSSKKINSAKNSFNLTYQNFFLLKKIFEID